MGFHGDEWKVGCGDAGPVPFAIPEYGVRI